MAVTPDDLLTPLGELEPAWFPADSSATLDARLQAYIDEANANLTDLAVAPADVDRAVKAWSYHRAYRAIWLRLAEAPSSITINDAGSRTRTDQQRDVFKVQSDRYLAAWTGIITVVEGETAVPTRSSTAAVNTFQW